MKGLLLKDFYSVRTEYKMYGIILPFLVAFMLLMQSPDRDVSPGSFIYLTSYFAIATLGLTINTFTYDEKFGFMKYALSTTVSRKNYIAEKYLFHLIHSVAGAFLGGLGMIVMTAILGGSLTSEAVLGIVFTTGGCFLAVLIMGIWQIGLSVRFDSAKARMIFGVMIFGVAILGAAAGMIGLLMLEEGIPLIIGGAAVIALGLTVWMFCMSFVWMKKKEF